jgi:hypothetical protein
LKQIKFKYIIYYLQILIVINKLNLFQRLAQKIEMDKLADPNSTQSKKKRNLSPDSSNDCDRFKTEESRGSSPDLSKGSQYQAQS